MDEVFSTRLARVDYLRDIGVNVAEEPVRVWDELVDGVEKGVGGQGAGGEGQEGGCGRVGGRGCGDGDGDGFEGEAGGEGECEDGEWGCGVGSGGLGLRIGEVRWGGVGRFGVVVSCLCTESMASPNPLKNICRVAVCRSLEKISRLL